MSFSPDERTLALALEAAPSRETAACADAARAWDAAAGALRPPAARTWLDHAAGCPDCCLALRAAREFRAAAGFPPAEPGGAWWRSVRFFFGPIPALAYLVLALAAWPAFWLATSRPVPATAPAAAALMPVRTIVLSGDAEWRGAEPPAVPSLALVAAPVMLRLALEPADVPASGGLVVRLIVDGRTVHTTHVARAAVEPDGSLGVLLDPRALGNAARFTVEVALDDHGTAGRTLFRQTCAR